MKLVYCFKCDKSYPFTKEFFYIRKKHLEKPNKIKNMVCKKCEIKTRTAYKKRRYNEDEEYRKRILKYNKRMRDPDYYRIYMKKLNDKMKAELGITYIGLHQYIARNIKKPEFCPLCNEKSKLELHCKEHKYSKDIEKWLYICRKCHFKLNQKIRNSDI